jgi:hypothetical protein
VNSKPFDREPQILTQSLTVSTVIVLSDALQEPFELVGALSQPGVVASDGFDRPSSVAERDAGAAAPLARRSDVASDVLRGLPNPGVEVREWDLPEQDQFVREKRERVETLPREGPHFEASRLARSHESRRPALARSVSPLRVRLVGRRWAR